MLKAPEGQACVFPFCISTQADSLHQCCRAANVGRQGGRGQIFGACGNHSDRADVGHRGVSGGVLCGPSPATALYRVQAVDSGGGPRRSA
jgi:hypothetical protein